MDSIKTPSLYVLFSRIPVVHLSQSQASWLWHEFGAESQEWKGCGGESWLGRGSDLRFCIGT